jgi:hypothetical protein
MKFNSTLIFLIAGLFVGFLAGKFYSKQNQNSPAKAIEAPVCEAEAPKSCKEFEDLKVKLDGVSPDQIRQYLRTQSAEAKLKKADEILGKIMAALVATVGYRLQKEDLDQFGKVEARFDTQPPPAPKPVVQEVEPPQTHPSSQINYRNIINEARRARTEEEAWKVVSSISGDSNQRIQNTGAVNSQQLEALNGTFEGLIVLADKTMPTTMEFHGTRSKDQIEGRAVLLIVDGKSRSRSTSSGNLTKNYSSQGPIVYVDAKDAMLEMIYFPGIDSWMGNYLKANDKRGTSFTKAGTVQLRRTGN